MNATNGSPRRPRRTLRSDIMFTFAVALALYVAWLLRHVLMLIYVSALFAVVLAPLSGFIGALHIGRFRPFRRFGIVILLLAVVGGLIAFGFLALPPAVRDLHDFGKEMPQRLPGILDSLKRLPFAGQIDTEQTTTRLENAITGTATYLLFSLKNLGGAIFDLAMGLVLTIYFSLEGETAYHWVLSFFEPRARARLDAALIRAEARMGRWLLGQGSLMLILGMASTVTYLALHLRYAYALGFLTGLLNIIPVVGAAVSIGIALLVAAIDSWGRVAGVAIFYAAYLSVENSFLIPRIMRSSVALPGLSILVALLVGAALGGVIGALVAVPTAVLVSVLVDEYLVVKEQ